MFFLVSLSLPFSSRFLLCLVPSRPDRLANDQLVTGFEKRPRRTVARSPRAVPWEIDAPVGCPHGNPPCRRWRRPRRPRPRICLRKGCGHTYLPRRWNQRYCQDPECQRQVRRWQAARRQARRRQDATAKAQHAQAQRARRQRANSAPQPPKIPEVTAARGHAAKIFSPTPVCDRPGCHEPPLKSIRNPARFCGPACRQAVRRVRERERKWRFRGTFQGGRARAREYAAARARRSGQAHESARAPPAPTPPPLTRPTGRAGRRLWPGSANSFSLGRSVRPSLIPLASQESQA